MLGKNSILEKAGASILPGATAVYIAMRHATSYSAGVNNSRTITQEGEDLCVQVRGFYLAIRDELRTELGIAQSDTTYNCSELPRSLITSWHIFGPPEIHPAKLLNYTGEVGKINGGQWQADRLGSTVPQMISDLFLESDAVQAPFKQDAYHLRTLICQTGYQKLSIGVSHEMAISYAADQDKLIPRDQLGLHPCEAIIFWLHDHQILAANKLVPFEVPVPLTYQRY